MCYANYSSRIRMLVLGIGVSSTILRQVVETTLAKAVHITVEEVATKTINSNLQDQPDILRGFR